MKKKGNDIIINKKSGKFRSKKRNFSTISNTLIHDPNLSLRAKGLYALIESYISIPDFTLYKWYLQSKCTEGQRAFDAAWNELKNSGYLIQYKIRKDAKTFYYEYELLDEPDIITKNERKKEDNSVKSLDPHFVGLQNEPLQNVDLQNVGVNNNTISNNTLVNNTIVNHIRQQISYDTFSTKDRPLVDNLVLLIGDVIAMNDNEVIRVDGRNMEARKVKDRFSLIDMGHIQYILWMLEENQTIIKNPKAYLTTMLYNAPSTMEGYMQTRVKIES